MTDVIGSAEFELRATLNKLRADLRQGEREVGESMKRMEREGRNAGDALDKGLGDGAKGALGKIAMLARGVGVFVTVLTAATLAALKFGRDGQQMASEIESASSRIGVSTNTLQEWRYVARRVGEDAQAADQALSAFGRKFGEAITGWSKDSIKPFEALGFTQPQLRQIGDAEVALDMVVRRIGELRSESERTMIADQLGLSPMVAALRLGGDEIEQMRQSAHRLGYVMDESMVRRASEAQREFDDLQELVGVQLRKAFVDLAPVMNVILGLATGITTRIRQMADGVRWMLGQRDAVSQEGLNERLSNLLARRSRIMENQRAPAVQGQPGTGGQGIDLATGLPNNPQRRREVELLDQQIQDVMRERAARSTVSTLPADDSGGRDLLPVPDPSSASEAARLAREAAARERARIAAQRRFDDLMFRAEADIAEAMGGRATSSRERTRLELEALEREQRAERTRLDRMLEDGDLGADSELAQARHDELVAAQERVAAARRQAIENERQADIAAEQAQVDQAIAGLTADLLHARSTTATTLEERQRLELELLDISQRQRRADLEALLASEDITEARKAELRAILERLDQAEERAVRERNEGPLARWMRQGQDLNTELEMVAADGLESLNDGLIDAIMNTRELGDVFRDVARGIIADLAAIAVRQGITEPLANLLFGGGRTSAISTGAKAASGGGFMGFLRGMFGFSDGGYTGAGGKHEPAGIVHKGEYVLSAEAVRRIGLANLDAMNTGLRGYADGGLVGLPGLPSMATVNLGRQGMTSPLSRLEIILKDDLLDARIDGRAVPIARSAAETSEARVRRDVPSMAVGAVADARYRRIIS